MSDGIWADVLTRIAETDPDFAPVAQQIVDARTTGALSPLHAAIVEMVVHGNVSYFDRSAFAEAVRAAAAAGASRAQLVKVVELTGVMAYHGVASALPPLVEMLGTRGTLPPASAIPPRTRANVERSMVAEWALAREQMLQFARVSPQLADVQADWTRVAWHDEVLDRKTKELVYLAFDATPTHIYLPGLAGHVYRCLEAGADHAEIAHVLAISLSPAVRVISEAFGIVDDTVGTGPASEHG